MLEQCAPLGLAQRLAVERHRHVKIEQGIAAELAADANRHARPGTAAAAPPVGQAKQQPALLQHRRVAKQAVRLRRGPG